MLFSLFFLVSMCIGSSAKSDVHFKSITALENNIIEYNANLTLSRNNTERLEGELIRSKNNTERLEGELIRLNKELSHIEQFRMAYENVSFVFSEVSNNSTQTPVSNNNSVAATQSPPLVLPEQLSVAQTPQVSNNIASAKKSSPSPVVTGAIGASDNNKKASKLLLITFSVVLIIIIIICMCIYTNLTKKPKQMYSIHNSQSDVQYGPSINTSNLEARQLIRQGAGQYASQYASQDASQCAGQDTSGFNTSTRREYASCNTTVVLFDEYPLHHQFILKMTPIIEEFETFVATDILQNDRNIYSTLRIFEDIQRNSYFIKGNKTITLLRFVLNYIQDEGYLLSEAITKAKFPKMMAAPKEDIVLLLSLVNPIWIKQ